MEFEWDEAKDTRNRVERALPFALAVELFAGFVLEQPDLRRDYGEIRVQAIGLAGGEVLFCVYTDRRRARRILSLRYANRRERDAYRAAQQR